MYYPGKFVAYLIICIFISSCKQNFTTQPRLVKTINTDWTFNYLPDVVVDSTIALPEFDDSRWKAIALPHTWSVYETTDEVHPFIYNASERDDSYWWYGWGYYRKTFRLNNNLKDKKVFIEFDGVQKNSKIFLNGKFIGDHKGGYTSFYFDLTREINWNSRNVIVVMVNNRRNDMQRIPPMNAGNWNVYGGIYRDVRLVLKNKIHIPFQGSYEHEGGTFITTPRVTKESADLRVKTWIKNDLKVNRMIELQTSVLHPDGSKIISSSAEKEIIAGTIAEFQQAFNNIPNPALWSPENPHLYKVLSTVISDGVIMDEYESPLGFRNFHWDYEENNLYLNGEKMNILGTNRHQEYPWLGDAHPKWIARMDMLDIKYNLGHNFMRLTHYPNDKYLYQLADSFGVVMVEEVPNIKSIDFSEEVQEQNVREMIRRDRNHPSILFWSMGNETTDAADSKWAVEEDTTRIIHLRKGEQGGDYVDHTHDNLDMEHLLRVTVRGWFDVDDAPSGFNSTPENGQHSSNETWQHRMARVRDGSVRGLLGENCVAWLYQDHGADREYLNCILKHINPKGWVDIYRQPKYLYWLTKAYYTDIPVLFIHPHFWRSDYIGQTKNIQIDSNCEEVELFVNGKTSGTRYPSGDNFNTVTFENIMIEPGRLMAAGKKNGKQFVHEIMMPGQPAKIVLTTEQRIVKADRSGIAIIIADIVDKDGNKVFDASNTLNWALSGPAVLVGPPVYESDIMKHEEMGGTGYTVVPVANLIRSTNTPGRIRVKVSADGLESGEIIIEAVKPDNSLWWIKEYPLSDRGRKPVQRIRNFQGEMKEIPLTIIPLRENYVIEGKSVKELRSEINNFIAERNYGNYNRYVAYSFLLEALALRLESMSGYLIADDFNFFINQYNALVVLEDYVESGKIIVTEKKDIKEKYAKDVLLKGSQIDIQEEIQSLKSLIQPIQ